MVRQLDMEAKRTGVTRQSLIKFWLSEKLKEISCKETGSIGSIRWHLILKKPITD